MNQWLEASSKENLTRILIGLLAVFLIGSLAQFLLPRYDPHGAYSGIGTDSFVTRFVAIAYLLSVFIFAIGGFIAQKNFTLPATIYAAATWLYGTYSGISRASNLSGELFEESIPASEVFVAALPKLLPYLLLNLVVAAAGSAIGMKLFAAIHSRGTNAR